MVAPTSSPQSPAPSNASMSTSTRALLDEVAAARRAGRTALDEPSAKRILAAFGLSVPAGRFVPEGSSFAAASAVAAAAVAAAAGLERPLAAKIVSNGAIHKSDVGGVRLRLGSDAALCEAITAMRADAARHQVDVSGFLIEEMAPAGTEVVIGGLMDARFGPVIMLGLGGIFVEIFDDTAFRVCPIDAIDALDMIDQLTAAPLLRGARGRAAVNEAALVAALMAVGGPQGLLITLQDHLAELDINPLIASAEGAVACDARIVLQQS